ncbi:hypothetical protein NEUTE1DRAFT_65502 [Neurospora tetrasperma FGSC 2508]|uniref:Thioredoxin domain-containing protein n=1 Tax=Neurospora tetrasperma (strain FGSC 2508 / ATCC MYA-4615 / P0657) TaxID=510951 RepID=F8MQS6_NEUT8|nr:uncharacterized protein NEUTE1DRAFT_65502 [Neurospora tetrasperma FGSC 2508]EGO56706.1 hypothetical protein NEUTE1DRAFT_65502 [Neurospora tetrasperma FGSC 2508]EGZ70419.1 hypothetical protein NEUTE2DRAFT_151183 [Neurospora tetrasperma FGSC 2509]
MRFSTSTIVLALPLLAAAESPLDQYKAKFQNFLGSFAGTAGGAAVPQADEVPQQKPIVSDTESATSSSVEPKHIERLTLANWKDTLYAPVQPEATTPEEWWVLVTGGNKTCFGRCGPVEKAFGETVEKFSTIPNSPHVAVLDCEEEPVLCNVWSAGASSLWVFDILPPPAAVDVYWKRLNFTTITAADLLETFDKETTEGKEAAGFQLVEGALHPFDGTLARYNLAVPIAYALHYLSIIPSWAMMLFVSFFSRTMMNRSVGGAQNRRANPARGAAPGDGRS